MKTVLYVDDNDEIIEIVNIVLSKASYNLVSENNSGNAIKVCLEKNPDLVLMDINMPGINGIEISKQLREKGFKNPIIILTASESASDKQKAKAAGCTDYVLKTVDMQNVGQIIDRYIGEAGEIIR